MYYNYKVTWGNSNPRAGDGTKEKKFSSYAAASAYIDWAVTKLTYVRLHDLENVDSLGTPKMYRCK